MYTFLSIAPAPRTVFVPEPVENDGEECRSGECPEPEARCDERRALAVVMQAIESFPEAFREAVAALNRCFDGHAPAVT